MTYQLAQWIFETPVEMVGSVVGSIITFYLVGFEGNVGIFIIVNYLCYAACYGVGSAIAVIPFSVSVNGGFAAFSVVGFMLSGDLLVTPYQIGRMYFLYGLEVMSPVRQTVVIELLEEADANPFGPQLLKSLGLDRVLEEKGVAWGLLAMNLVVYRMIPLAVIWFAVWFDRRRVGIMHSH
eukprot:TRINITY_DN8948_c0_g1_i3.p1 TRINITY_DN8948_c0_g1~~TRINITY_DN8948_c0_g1_i3.p1  ORF type:complete len:180 (-),score=16.77 TRINITY_DN8948_c0_g1_i3:26-565(-)